jgi:putative membrane protein
VTRPGDAHLRDQASSRHVHVRPAAANYCRRAGIQGMEMKPHRIAGVFAGLFFGTVAMAASLQADGPASLPPIHAETSGASPPASLAAMKPGSASLVPLMASDAQAHGLSTLDAGEPAAGGDAGKPVDDLSFVAQATEAGREEVKSAREALPRLRDPELREMAEVLAHHHDAANERLARIAEAKGWPLPAPRAEIKTPAPGTATPDFDARWTDDMIAGHERALALYRAQAQGGEDKDLRKYARETLPTLEQHLDWLRSLQK